MCPLGMTDGAARGMAFMESPELTKAEIHLQLLNYMVLNE
jgi:hypothetical protein